MVAESGPQPINTPDDWWAMIMGTGYRATLEQLSSEDLVRVRNENLDFIRSSGLRSVETNVLYAVAHPQIAQIDAH